MAKRKTSKKSVKKKTARRVARSARNPSRSKSFDDKRKLNVVVWNLGLFVILCTFSYVLYSVSGTVFYQELFYLGSLLFGVVALTFLIVLLVLLVLKWIKK